MYRLKKPQLIISTLLAALVTMVLLCGSCSGLKHAAPTIVDSTVATYNTVERDTNIIAPGAKATLSITMAQLLKAAQDDYNSRHAPSSGFIPGKMAPTPTSLGESQNKQAGAKATIQNGNLQIECTCDSMTIAAKLLDRYLTTKSFRTVTLPPKEVKYVPWYINSLAGVGLFAILIAGLLIYRRLKR